MRLLHRFLFLLALTSTCLYAQEQGASQPQEGVLWQEFSVQHDNDFLFAIDRYYTAGSFLTYSKQLKGDFIFKSEKGFPIQLDLVLGQETYTPRELFETDFDRLERPYAGYVFVSGTLSKGSAQSAFSIKGEVGLAGEQSQAGNIQVAYHELINEFIPVWAGEIANSVHINGYGSYVRDFKLENSNLFKNFALQSTAAIGTRRIFARQEALLFAGKRDEIGASSAFNRLGGAEEFYVFGGAGIEYVYLNALIQGHPWGDDSPFTLPIVSTIISFKAGGVYRGLRNTYRVIYQFRTPETEREGRSQFVTFSFSRRF